jgi:hypothetical protein
MTTTGRSHRQCGLCSTAAYCSPTMSISRVTAASNSAKTSRIAQRQNRQSPLPRLKSSGLVSAQLNGAGSEAHNPNRSQTSTSSAQGASRLG